MFAPSGLSKVGEFIEIPFHYVVAAKALARRSCSFRRAHIQPFRLQTVHDETTLVFHDISALPFLGADR
jgi:hypothetical protein